MDSNSQNSARCPVQRHIVLNALLLSPEAGYRNAGVSQYIQALLRTLPATPDLELTACVGAAVSDEFAGWQMRRSRVPGQRPLTRILWEQTALPLLLRRLRADLVHAPVNVGPFVRPCPMVVTVHDLAFILYPETFRKGRRFYQTVLTRWTAQRAERVIAVSANTAADLVRLFGVPRERITVVPNGVDPSYHPLPPTEVEEFRRRRGLPERFLLCVATMEPRKNLPRLLEALARVPQAPPLVLCGGRGWYYDEVFATIERLGLQQRVHLPGFISQVDLPYWYNAASWFVYPSLYEGFGLPALEALACGTPCLVSRASSLPEVVGDAALLVDPLDVDDIARGIALATGDGALAEGLRAAGPARAAQFPWSRTARETAAVYADVLRGAAHV